MSRWCRLGVGSFGLKASGCQGTLALLHASGSRSVLLVRCNSGQALCLDLDLSKARLLLGCWR